MAWRGRVSPTTSSAISAGPRDWVSWRGGESEITNASCQGLRQHIILQARRRSRRSEQQPRSPTHSRSHSRLAVPTVPAADADAARRACQLPVHGPVRHAARAWSTSHHFLTHTLSLDASRICMRAERQASSCASAPQPGELNPTPAVILSLGPRLARRFARSLHLHPYNCALLHRCMPPCFARVLLLSPPRFPFALQTFGRLALFKHSCL
jgi:hypothetical protein